MLNRTLIIKKKQFKTCNKYNLHVSLDCLKWNRVFKCAFVLNCTKEKCTHERALLITLHCNCLPFHIQFITALQTYDTLFEKSSHISFIIIFIQL